MAKARSRVAARKVKDKWKGKAWYDVEAPVHFGRAKIAQSLADDPQKLVGRIAETTLQDLTGDFKQMHVKLQFRIDGVDGTIARSSYAGHSLTSDYLRRMTRRNHSKVDAVVEVTTKDGGVLRVKPFTVSDKRSQTTQERALRNVMRDEITKAAQASSLNRLVRDIVDGKLAAQIAKACRPIYPVRRVEIQKTEVKRLPQVEIEEDWEAEFAKKEEPAEPAETEAEPEAEAGTQPSETEDAGDEKEGEEKGEGEGEEAVSEAGEDEGEKEGTGDEEGPEGGAKEPEKAPAPKTAPTPPEDEGEGEEDEGEAQEVTAERKE